MKKQDLVPGQVYANKRGAPRLLINSLVWSKSKVYGQDATWWLMRANARPHKGQGYGHSGAGVLSVLAGISGKGGKELQEWSRERGAWWVERLSSITAGSRGTLEHNDLIAQLREEVRVHNFHLDTDNYVTWAGPWEEVTKELEERSRLVNAEYERLDGVANRRIQRVERIRTKLQEQYGIEKTEVSLMPTTGQHNVSRSLVKGLTLSLGDLEIILNTQEDK